MMARPRKPVPEWAAEGRRLRAEGLSWRAIAARLGFPLDMVRYWCCDAYRTMKLSRRVKRWRRPMGKEERLRRSRESQKRTRARKLAETGMLYSKWASMRRYCRELAAQQGRPVEELYAEFGVQR